ncbi:MAG: translational GTPase TypA [Planctomycetota bacterium]|jgi:GTP-binding protein
MAALRNIAIIAHVDHGKTTLVDQMLRQSGVFRVNQEVQDLVMDSEDLERERGITILAKNTGIFWGDTKINVVDTPGHADFGGEVERVLQMVDGVLLLVDAFEGPMAQTRFVLRKAFESDLKAIVVINKVDRPHARPVQVLDEMVNLFCDLEVEDHQLEFRTLYASGRDGWAVAGLGDEHKDLRPLFEAILDEIPAPRGDPSGRGQLSIAAVDYDPYVGRIAIGRVREGTLRKGERVALMDRDRNMRSATIEQLMVFDKLAKQEVEEVGAGEICAIVGLEEAGIGETITDPDAPSFIDVPPVEEPTIAVEFTINTSPLVGRDGSHVQSRKLKQRLFREAESDVALRVEETGSADSLKVSGRGTLHIGILVEKLRREDYEFAVGRPQVIMRGSEEPMERLIVDVPAEHASTVVSMLAKRKGELEVVENRGEHVRQEYVVPSRGLIGLRTRLLTRTRGEAVSQSLFVGYGPHRGSIPGRTNGVQVSMAAGKAVAYSLFNLKDRGPHFVAPGEAIYEGMVVGEHCRPEDIEVNPCKGKKLTNIRAAGSDESVILSPPRVFSIEEALEYIQSDELLEVTPHTLRLRKRVLGESERRKLARAAARERS